MMGYLIIPASNEHSRLGELGNIQNWAVLTNLKLMGDDKYADDFSVTPMSGD